VDVDCLVDRPVDQPFGREVWTIVGGRPLDMDVDPQGSTSPTETLNFGCVCG